MSPPKFRSTRNLGMWPYLERGLCRIACCDEVALERSGPCARWLVPLREQGDSVMQTQSRGGEKAPWPRRLQLAQCRHRSGGPGGHRELAWTRRPPPRGLRREHGPARTSPLPFRPPEQREDKFLQCVTAAEGNECTYCAPGAAPPGIQPSIRTNVEQPPCVRRSPGFRAGADGPCPPVPEAARVCAVAGWLGARVGQPCPLCGARSSSVMSTHTRV